MKKRTPSDFIWDNICRVRRELFNKERKAILKARKIKSDDLNAYKRQPKYTKGGTILSPKYHKGLKKIPCPKNVCLDSNIDETIKFLKKIPGGISTNRKSMRRLNRKSKTSKVMDRYFDFPSIEKICPASALIISANYSTYRRRGGIINVVRWGKWNKKVKQTLTKMGFFELLGFTDITTDESLQDIPIKGFKMDRTASNQIITPYFTQLVTKVSAKFNIHKDDMVFKQTMFAIEEAVENSTRHAYVTENSAEFSEDVRGAWWFGGMPLIDKKQITLVCYDKGRSIPRSIKESYLEPKKRIMHDWVNQVMNKAGMSEFDNNLDHKRLEIAMEYLTSSTGNKGGGKGLSHIVKSIDGFKDGSNVRIMSRRAYAIITKGKDNVFTLLDTPIIGTLIIWEIRL
ncbi:MAG: hypothetical protein K8953_06165 [Proteobacteria bacterium]|nr:hypothetical protein [Pseudomonadota bacterium]